MPDPDPSSLPSPSTREEANYSREEFERDRFGQTGDDLAAPCGPQKPTAEAARSASPRRLEALALDAVAQIIRYVPDVEHPESYASIEVFLETSGLRQWVQIINGDRVCIDEMHADIGQAIEEGLLVALEEASSLRLQAGMDDVSPAGSPSDLATIESLQSEISTLRSTHATLQSALRELVIDWRGTARTLSADAHDSTLLREEQAYSAAKRTTLTWCADKLDKALNAPK